ncbi:MAG: trimethylamine methyltransferase family protein [Candidatus Thermoplasmatota archaeon]|nr:trimethylamine methyltransferase family protein [Candidatus Thermoplasmatota archaeon]
MARGQMTFFRPEEIKRVHDASIRLLEEVGIQMRSASVSEMLEAAGATRSNDGKRLLIREEMVREALASVPKSILLAGRGDAKDMRIPSNKDLFVATGGEGVHLRDLVEGTTRATTRDDLRDCAIVVESLPQIDYFWELVGAQEFADSGLKSIAQLATSLQYTSKHIQGEALSAEAALDQIEMAAIVAGGERELARRPILSSVQCPISPLIFEAGLSEAQVAFAEAGVPVVAMSAAMAGLTAPVTIAGTITQTNAENLASLVITQTARKGAPWIYSSDSAPADLRIGVIDYRAIEGILTRTAAGQMGRYYGLPVMCASIGVENMSGLLGSVREGVHHMIIEAQVPSDLSSGIGGLDLGAGASLEQIVIDAWIWDVAREVIREFDIDDDAIAIETVRESAMDGNFLARKHTMRRFKQELSATRHPEAVWNEESMHAAPGALARKAREETKRILKEPKKTIISRDISKQLETVIERARERNRA